MAAPVEITMTDPVQIETAQSGLSTDHICVADESHDNDTVHAKKKAKKAKPKTSIAGRSRPDLTWNDRAIGVFLYHHLLLLVGAAPISLGMIAPLEYFYQLRTCDIVV